MSKLKQTKLKHRKNKNSKNSENTHSENTHSETSETSNNSLNHKTKKYKILTSKNKNKLVLKDGRYYRKNHSKSKKHKRSKKQLNIRTLDALKRYGSILKNQDGGFIINYLKFKWNMRKIKHIIEKLGKNQKELNEFIDSYKKQPETFKRLADKKAVVIYDILRTEKEKTIIEFLLANRDKEKTYDTSNMQHDLDMIKTKIEISTTEQLKQLNAEIKKEKPKYDKNKEKFLKDSKKFEKINEDYSKLMAFYVEQKELSDKYDGIKDLQKLTKQDKEIKNKYLKNEENIKYILSYKQEDISAINKNIKELATIMNMSHDYDEKFKTMTQDYYNTDLQQWQANYKAIYENISTIEDGIDDVKKTLEKIKEYATQIGSNLSSIYASIKQNIKLDPILQIKRIIDENLGYLKNVKEVSLKKVKYAFIEQIPIEQIEIYLPLAEASLIQTEKSMNELNSSFILDSSFIRTGHAGGGRWKGRRMGMNGVGDSNGISSIGELEWFGKGGVTIISYDDLLKLTIRDFLDKDYRDIIATLETMNTDLDDTSYSSDIYKLKNYEFLNIMKIYFNVYLFFEYYFNSRTGATPVVPPFTTLISNNRDKHILELVYIITKYETIIKDYKDVTFNNLPTTRQIEIKKHINDLKTHVFDKNRGSGFLFNINANIKINYFDRITPPNKIIWNPFRQNDDLSLKNLYCETNPHSTTASIDLSCIDTFIGYYIKTNPEITKYNEKDKCDITGSKPFDKDALYNKYDDIPILYKDVNDGNKYKFVTIYCNKYGNNTNTINTINIKKNSKSDEIDAKFKNLIVFLAHPNQLNININNKKHKDDLISDIYNASEFIKDDYDILFCNDDSNTTFEKIINDEISQYAIKICDDSLNSNHWSISYIKDAIVRDWTIDSFNDHNTNHIQTLTDSANPRNTTQTTVTNPVGPGPKNAAGNDIPFINIYNNKFPWLKKNIIPLILKNIYNNVDYNKPIQHYAIDRQQNFTNLNPTAKLSDTTLLTILKYKEKKDTYYVMLYQYKNLARIETDIQTDEKMQKYLFTWLKSKCNQGVDELQTDTISDFIYTLYETTSKSKTLLSDLDINNIDKNELYKAFNNTDKKEFKTMYEPFLDQAKINLTDLTKTAVVLKEDKLVNTITNPILPRTETRLVFDLPQSNHINENNPYNTSDFTKKIVSDIITKSYNKKGNYKNIPLKYVKRIVSFNVNNWNRSIDSINLINPKPEPPTLLLTDPKNAITFIKTKLPDTDILGFLDYSLYTNGAAANRHIKDRVTPGDQAEITVDNKYTEELIKNELNLDNYYIKNDNYDNVVSIPILNSSDNMFLGKALYYNDKKTTISKPDPLCKIQAHDILYSEVLINKQPIGFYLINRYAPLRNKTELDTLIKCINDHTTSQNLYETVIMGTFTLDNNTATPAYKKEDFIDDMKTLRYNQFGNVKGTCINSDPIYYYIDLCFVSDDFEKKFTILNDEIVVPSGSVSSHYPIYLDIIENQDIDIEDDDFVVFYSDENIEIYDIFTEFKFNLTLKKKPTVGGSKSRPKPKHTPKIIKLNSDGSYDIEIVDSDGNIISDDRYKSATIDKTTNIITIKDKNGKTSMTIDKDSRKITRFEEDGITVKSTSIIDKDGTFITTDKDGKEYKSKYGADGKPETKDISTGEMVKSYYDETRNDLEKAKKEGKRLLSTFIEVIDKENISTIVSKNRDSILNYIKKIIDLIQTKLKHDNYEKITLKLNALAKNIIELKEIEPKLTPDKVLIKEYAQKSRSYDWMEDVTKREKVSLSLHDEAKELEAIIKTHPEIKDILPSATESITREDLLELTSRAVIDTKNRTLSKDKESTRKILKKLENPNNVKKLVEYLRKEYESDSNNLCNYLVAIMTSVNSKLLTELYENFVCIKNIAKQKEDEKAKYKK